MPPNVLPEATEVRGADRHGSFSEPSPGERIFRRVLGWRDEVEYVLRAPLALLVER